MRPLCGLQFLHVEEPELVGGRRVVKAALDRVGALVALLLPAPLLFGTAIAVRMTSPGTMLFTQVRVCKDGASSHSASSAP